VDRRDRILAPLGNLGAGGGLEIGALHHPIVRRPDANVLYVDHADTASLRAKYAGDADVTEMVDVDVVWGDQPLADALGPRAPVDWVVASHVIEHVPNIVGWFDELAAVLRDGGIVSLAIPDKRYCFDIRRRETDPADVVGAWLAGSTRPSLGMVYEFYARIEQVDAQQAWRGAYDGIEIEDNVDQGLEWARTAAASDDYTDIHCWAFTPASFVATLRTLFRLRLTSFAVASLAPTIPGELEFFCVLERLPRHLDAGTRQGRQLESLAGLDLVTTPASAATATTATADAVPDDRPGERPGERTMVISDREARLVAAKRRTFEAGKAIIRRARARVAQPGDDRLG
jgi:SAM-dependent methyltransferase